MLSKLDAGSISPHSLSLLVWVVYASESLDTVLCDRAPIVSPVRVVQDASAEHVLEAMGIPRREARRPRILMIRRFLQLSESEPRKSSNKQRNGRLQ